jgi:glucosamine--fructose-6-phosphate aminotransferase (isomerizing)
MKNALYEDIQAQATNIAHVIEHLYGSERPRIDEAGAMLQNDKPIAIIGMGSAAYLSMTAQYYLGEQGRFASVVYGSDAFYSLLPMLQKANVIVNSRSGATVEIVKVTQALGEMGVPIVALTNEPDSTLAQYARHVIWSDTHKDDLVSINVVTGMMLATVVLAAAAVGQMDQIRPHVERLPRLMEDVIERAWQKADNLTSIFEQTRPIYLLARGASKGAAYCGRLVLEEVARWPAVALEAAEFRQGPIEVVDERFGVLIFAGAENEKQSELNRSLATSIADQQAEVLLVGAEEAGSSKNVHAFPLPSIPDYLRPVLEVIPAQVLAYKLAEKQGYPPGETRYITKVITTEQGIPRGA